MLSSTSIASLNISQFSFLHSQSSISLRNKSTIEKVGNRGSLRSIIKANIDVSPLSIRPGANVTDKLQSDFRKLTMVACGRRVTTGDVASKASIKLDEAQKALQALAAATSAAELFFLLDMHSSSSTSCKTPWSTMCQTTPSTAPPVPKRVPFKLSSHKKKWKDPYHWMQQKNDPDFIKYLDQENSYSDDFMDDTKDLQDTFYAEMKDRVPSSKFTIAPRLSGPWFYYEFIPEGKEYPVGRFIVEN